MSDSLHQASAFPVISPGKKYAAVSGSLQISLSGRASRQVTGNCDSVERISIASEKTRQEPAMALVRRAQTVHGDRRVSAAKASRPELI